ncbi:hypothetical protein DAPPUDRAFT_115246 [Daphnia pulex]|uniref:Uncharacterized protein n=1 Tax=Daphnia pulex TaxID=6669 RepID=E9HKR1_DAPPU|nr:hypothetical protein DAPPUDRAFT_115246 [Daphnia pulex]|eukprot:EFX67672.1 hypothetical protein DAPPUDRAFT_115246 [Daphnia pulex]
MGNHIKIKLKLNQFLDTLIGYLLQELYIRDDHESHHLNMSLITRLFLSKGEGNCSTPGKLKHISLCRLFHQQFPTETCVVNGNVSTTVNNHQISSDVPDGVVFTSSDVRYKNRPLEGYVANFQGNQPQISYFNYWSNQGSPSAAPVVLDGLVVTHGVNGGPSVEDTPLVLDGLIFKYRDVRPKEPTA